MEKRGQVTVFIILAICLAIAAGLFYYLTSYQKTSNVKSQTAATKSDAVDVVKSYAENCLKKVSEEALFNKIGVQGGYVSTSEMPSKTLFDGYDVPYYLDANCRIDSELIMVDVPDDCPCDPSIEQCPLCGMHKEPRCIKDTCRCDVARNIPILDTIKSRLSTYIQNSFENCFKTDVFDSVGIKVMKEGGSITPEVNINKEDVSIKLLYPLAVKKGDSVAKLESFIIVLPIRLEQLYNSADNFVRRLSESIGVVNGRFGQCGTVECTARYVINPDCQSSPKYNKNGLTNLYAKNAVDGGKIIQFVDFKTYMEEYLKSFAFQFAVKGVEISGACAG